VEAAVDPLVLGSQSGWPPAGRLDAALRELQRHLDASSSVSELLRRATERAADACGFERALVLQLRPGSRLEPTAEALADPASDALRRRATASSLRLEPGTAEAEFVRSAEGGRGRSVADTTTIGASLGLVHHALGAIMPQNAVLALLVVDRSSPAIEPREHDRVALFAHCVTACVERVGELKAELRHLTTSAVALIEEVAGAPISLPSDYGSGPVFVGAGEATAPARSALGGLTGREADIGRLIVLGRSNREIAAELNLSPDTVKGYVGSLLRKLGAANRAEAAARLMRDRVVNEH
jgi:DNA-binding CsgD family transcriptional regulator